MFNNHMRRYNVRSWLDSISVGTNGSTFSQLMYYNRPHPSGGTTRTWNGNISAIDWRSGSDIGTSSYKYSYDGLSRLKSATHRPAAGFNVFKSWTYDRQGNIMSEGRNISYTLAGNQMTRKTISLEEAFIDPRPFIPDPFVLEPEPEPFIPEPIGHGDPVITPVDSLPGSIIPVLPGEIIYEYTYDANGRMVSDTERGIQRIRYNVLDLPSRVEFRNDTIPDIYYLYAADGRKLEQGTIHSTNGTHFGDIQYIYTPHITYQGNLAYVDGVLDRILIDGGYISAADNVYHFFVTDHLGSVRVVARADGTVEKCYDYDPYGADLYNNQGTTVPDTNPYKFSGKELDQVLSNYNFGARLFGPSKRRWTTMDPYCWKYYSISPYAYCAGNPVNIVDPEGMDWFYYSLDGFSDPTWNWRDEEYYHTGVFSEQGKEIVLTGAKAVVIFDGSRLERLGTDGTISGNKALTANVTILGPDGADDISTYMGFTMTSNADLFVPIGEGIYDCVYMDPGKGGVLSSHWALNDGGIVPTMDNLPNTSPFAGSNYGLSQKTGIYIHRTNNNGYAASTVSTGCLLIEPGLWGEFNSKLYGLESFTVQVKRKDVFGFYGPQIYNVLNIKK